MDGDGQEQAFKTTKPETLALLSRTPKNNKQIPANKIKHFCRAFLISKNTITDSKKIRPVMNPTELLHLSIYALTHHLNDAEKSSCFSHGFSTNLRIMVNLCPKTTNPLGNWSSRTITGRCTSQVLRWFICQIM